MVPKPVVLLTVAPEQVISATSEGSLALTVPATGDVVNQSLVPGEGRVTFTVGGVLSVGVAATTLYLTVTSTLRLPLTSVSLEVTVSVTLLVPDVASDGTLTVIFRLPLAT